MPSRRFIRTTLLRLAAAAACAAGVIGAVAAAAAQEPAHVVQDPHYGDVLFQFYQPHYFTALTTLMASQHFARVSRHADEAEILRGGLLLSYGMHREAGEVFAQLIEKGTTPAVRDRAWFFLAKIRYQRGFPDQAQIAIDRIGTALPPELEDERGLMHANLMMERADYAGAAAVLNGMTKSKTAGNYARFNLGVALIRNGDVAGGSALLDELGRAPAADEEMRSLRDKANVALGFAALQDKRPELARTYLERVRLVGLQSNKALLGFGWAAAALKEPKLALVPWTELAGRDASDAAVLEARIALPYAYAELGAQGQSLARYNDAIAVFEREHTSLDESIASIRSGKLMNALLERNPGEEMGWFWALRNLPEMPHAGHQSQVLARNDFQEAFKNFRDLQFLSGNLQQWSDNLGVFSDMLDNRRKAYAERVPQVRAKAREVGLDAAQQRSEVIAKDLAQAETDGDGVALADAKQRDLLTRLAGLRAAQAQPATTSAAELSAAAEIALMSDRVRRVAGALTWQLAQQYPAKVWEARKSMTAIDAQLAQARTHDAALAQAQLDEPARVDRLALRIKELGPRLQVLMPRVAALATEQRQGAQAIAVAELSNQKERLAVYNTQARFAVAQLYDRANLPREAANAAKP